MTTRTATLIGLTAILMWSLLAVLTVATGKIPAFQLAAMTFAIGALVESGAVVLACDGQRFELSAGDCVTFDADLSHHFENSGPDEAVLLAVVSAGLRRS